MTTASPGVRALMIYALVLPLALMLGYLLATPTDLSSIGTVALVISVLALPLVLKWYWEALLLSWNMIAMVFFLPGSPELWLVMAFFSLTIALAQRAMTKDVKFIPVPSLTIPLVSVLLVVAVTARLNGGIGVRALGSQTFGGRGYLWIFGGAAGFWAIISRRVPVEKASLYCGLFWLGGLASVIPTLVSFGPSEFYGLTLIFPVEGSELIKMEDTLGYVTGFRENIARFAGLTFSATAAFCFLLAHYGIRDMLSGTKLWRFVLLAALVLIGSLGGFRSMIVVLALTFFLTFYFEGLFRSKYAAILLGVMLLGGAFLVPFANQLPLSVQRALSILPLNVDPVARFEAQTSTEWRVEMWSMLLPLVPKYLGLGKGLAVSGSELQFAGDLAARGQIASQELSIISGNYHNGPLTLLIPFGIWGAIAWLWFLIAAIRALYLNYRHGDQALRKINTFFLAFFLTKTIAFLTIYGDFRTDFAPFVGVVAFSVALNGGICRRTKATAVKQAAVVARNGEPIGPAPAMA
jgi:hypothetical protein